MLAFLIFEHFSGFFCVLGFLDQKLENPLIFLCKMQRFIKDFREKQEPQKNIRKCSKFKNANMTYFSECTKVAESTVLFSLSPISYLINFRVFCKIHLCTAIEWFLES